ncbi:MAG: RnfABCDGE type electron transport complex subunit D [Planctomycetes bacterium]|nr:RnfABCDGE type electron transport complex subunit D [Planctomycetota bacterium]
MINVLVAAAPPLLGSVYFFGLRSLLVLAVCNGVGFVVEWLFVRQRGKPVTSAVFVTATLYSLILPPQTPLLIAVVGIVVAVLFGKMVFGGFGANVFNPALVGRCFVYVNFPKHITSDWADPFTGGLGGFLHWGRADAFTGATPLDQFKSAGQLESIKDLFFGNIGGSFGETSALLILIGAAYLLYRKTANWRIMVSVAGSAFAFSAILHYAGVKQIPPPHWTILAGGLLFGAVYMATDPISAARTPEGMFLYGSLIGMVTVVIRAFSGFSGGMNFAILLGNMFAPITDYAVKAVKEKRKVAAGAGSEPG